MFPYNITLQLVKSFFGFMPLFKKLASEAIQMYHPENGIASIMATLER
jgi:hypothetical protein